MATYVLAWCRAQLQLVCTPQRCLIGLRSLTTNPSESVVQEGGWSRTTMGVGSQKIVLGRRPQSEKPASL